MGNEAPRARAPDSGSSVGVAAGAFGTRRRWRVWCVFHVKPCQARTLAGASPLLGSHPTRSSNKIGYLTGDLLHISTRFRIGLLHQTPGGQPGLPHSPNGTRYEVPHRRSERARSAGPAVVDKPVDSPVDKAVNNVTVGLVTSGMTPYSAPWRRSLSGPRRDSRPRCESVTAEISNRVPPPADAWSGEWAALGWSI